ncbi:isocitrate lyase/phosphoenolpyruvate mutase family protein [Actinomadura luzonensis]|uniref:isocitrate lyase/phosphoenolpyruvate mutase family protein n=1 Tax=Actinomadura luzonensis TaxID=2805427 RepID=UPI001F57D488|nr:isocitrate lyase/phosphoenolpyruvate mutase family protein [Actinomadura luzonensis]
MTAGSLRTALTGDGLVRLVGVHDGLSALLVEKCGLEGIWVSGLAVSAAQGVADAGLLTMTEFLAAATQIRMSCSLPVVADVDSGFGDVNVVQRMVRLYEQHGIDAVCIEDKQFPKRNSFSSGNRLESPEAFAEKIAAAKAAQRDAEFMVIARHESFIVGESLDQALGRAELSVAAGADAILIHSKKSCAGEIEAFCREWRTMDGSVPVFAVPTTFHSAEGADLRKIGVSAAIYANQLIRASVSAARQMLECLVENDSLSEAEDRIAGVDELFELTGMSRIAAGGLWIPPRTEL